MPGSRWLTSPLVRDQNWLATEALAWAAAVPLRVELTVSPPTPLARRVRLSRQRVAMASPLPLTGALLWYLLM